MEISSPSQKGVPFDDMKGRAVTKFRGPFGHDGRMEARSAMKQILSILNLLLGIAAAVTVLGICLLALFVGGMAGPRGLFFILPTFGLSAWILICAFSPSTFTRIMPNSASWRFVLMKLPVYAVACVGIYYGVYQWRVRFGTPSVMVSQGDRQFPVSNPIPTKILEISGTLPMTVPVKDLIAIYTAESSQNSLEACTRREDFAPKNDPRGYPLVHLEHIPMVRTGETYRSSVAIDRFNPGPCGWHLKEVTYLLDVKGYRERDFAYWFAVVPRVELLTQPQAGGERSNSAVHGRRADVWCWKVTNHEYNPFVPVRCNAITDALKWPGQRVTATLSVADRHSTGVAYGGPESSSVEFNFHDLDAPPRQPAEPPSQVREIATAPTETLPSPASPPSQFTESPTRTRESPMLPTASLPSPTNAEVGTPVNISIGESFEDVHAALGNRAVQEQTSSAVHTNAQSLTLRDSGVRVFFNESKVVYEVRIDAPAPPKQIQALSNRAGSSFLSDIDASTRVASRHGVRICLSSLRRAWIDWR